MGHPLTIRHSPFTIHNYSLLLVRHAQPEIDPKRPAAEWPLSEEGRAGARALADRLDGYRPLAVVASKELKAQQTAEILATALDLPWRTAPDLHEHERHGTPFLTRDKFQALITKFFARPERLVFGSESAAKAGERFTQAVRDSLSSSEPGDIIVVAHGTVMTLLVCAFNPFEPLSFWQELTMPAAVVLSQDDFGWRETIPL